MRFAVFSRNFLLPLGRTKSDESHFNLLRRWKKRKKQRRAQINPFFFAYDRSIAVNKSCCFSLFFSSHHFEIFCGGKKACCEFTERNFFVKSTLVRISRPKTHKNKVISIFYFPVQGPREENIDFLFFRQ